MLALCAGTYDKRPVRKSHNATRQSQMQSLPVLALILLILRVVTQFLTAEE